MADWLTRWLQRADDELLDVARDPEGPGIPPDVLDPPPRWDAVVPSPPYVWDTLDEEPEAL